ncbi:retron system putative HNH endonuclease [Hyalangium versicolor]|uniref:retron system putative HNH endonuclease n=1 Tax=Hyalangium versicolor TaxID=2861190 RepID=UPI001CCBB02E|nr:retron system putative HNH endonuclease [Hyalangium versicolor]
MIPRNRKRWLEALARATTPEERERALSRYRHDDIKAALKTAFHGKCAYCESFILHIDYPHIEHFRPKSKYPNKAFDWSNLLLACGVCNGSEHKGDEFPLKADKGPLVNPCAEEPATHLSFDFDPVTRLASVTKPSASDSFSWAFSQEAGSTSGRPKTWRIPPATRSTM